MGRQLTNEDTLMRKLHYLAAAGIMAVATCASLATKTALAAGPGSSDLQTDLQSANQTGEKGVANDTDTAAEFDNDTAQVNDVQSQENQTGDQGSTGQGNGAVDQGKAPEKPTGDQGTAGDANSGAASDKNDGTQESTSATTTTKP